ncbi:MAG TPA: PCYCGC motif-containing (lipo)protein [Candidatus Acidoferrales bacterium]|nr:PCYCGC motif-containing (lipo)protein [Candidatus Acidoferrales bacterium]
MPNRLGMGAMTALLIVAGISFGDAARAQLGSVKLDVPAYHAAPPARAVKLAATLPASYFPNDPTSERAYAAAAKIKPLLYQMPCYCHCDKEMGHTSLLSCYQDRHASICGTCKMELYYAYMESRKGKTALRIREGIMRGDWEKVDMSSWNAPYTPAPGVKK